MGNIDIESKNSKTRGKCCFPIFIIGSSNLKKENCDQSSTLIWERTRLETDVRTRNASSSSSRPERGVCVKIHLLLAMGVVYRERTGFHKIMAHTLHSLL